MQVILEVDEAWSIMTLMTAYIIDHVGLSGDGRAKVRRWRQQRSVGTVEMDQLALAINEALGTYLDEKTTRRIRMRGRFVSSKEL